MSPAQIDLSESPAVVLSQKVDQLQGLGVVQGDVVLVTVVTSHAQVEGFQLLDALDEEDEPGKLLTQV